MNNGHKVKEGKHFTQQVKLENVKITEFNRRIFPIFNSSKGSIIRSLVRKKPTGFS